MLGRDEALSLLERVLAPMVGEADALEAHLTSTEAAFTRLANAEVFQDSTLRDSKVQMRALVNGRRAAVETNDLSPESLRRACERAIALTKTMAARPWEFGFGEASPEPDASSTVFDDETARLSPGRRLEQLSGPISLARQRGLLLAGRYTTAVRKEAIWNSLGLERYGASTRAEINLTAVDGLAPGASAGFSGGLQAVSTALGIDALAERAIEKSERGANPIELEPNTYDVILEPSAVAQLLEWLTYIAFSTQSVEDGMSFMMGRKGEMVTGERVTFVDDWTASNGISLPFDGEGSHRQHVVLIDAGKAVGQVTDRRFAQKTKTACTGHSGAASRAEDAGALPANLVMRSGDDTEASLLARVERGLWVTDFHYVNGMIEPKRAVMTGLTRNGTFLIENGRLTHGVRNLRFTDSVLEAFTRIEGISKLVKATPTWWSTLGAVIAPTVLIRGLQFTGKTTA